MLQNPPRETCSHSMPWQTLKKSLQNGQVLCPNIWNFGCQGISSKVSDSLLSSCCTHVSFVQHLFQHGRHLFWLSFSWVGPFFERESSSHESLSFFIIQYHLAMYCNNDTLTKLSSKHVQFAILLYQTVIRKSFPEKVNCNMNMIIF